MSGFVGIVSTTGEPVSHTAVESLTRFLNFRGPDVTSVTTHGAVGLGHTLLRTGPHHPREQQPATLDGDVWIVGDIRIDGRSELTEALKACGRSLRIDATSAELVLHSYAAWGHACLDRFIGDFAFALWDAPRKSFFCARDQMGVKPFFYARTTKSIIVSNTLDCVRRHTDVSADFNDLAIADFLMFGYNLDASSTAFAAIHRLPAAHAMTLTAGEMTCWRYWTLPVDEPVYLKRSGDYVDRFNELLADSVRDRFGTDRLSIYMSGGLDSTLLAAEAKAQARATNGVISAFTYVHDRSIDGDERKFAALVASHLQIPIRYWAMDMPSRSSASSRPSTRLPEPAERADDILFERQRYQEIASKARVAFYGEGPDNALQYEWRPHLRFLWSRRRWLRMVQDVAAHVAAHRRVPLLPTIPRMIAACKERSGWELPFPEWLNPDLVQRFDLRGRWAQQMHVSLSASPVHPVRPRGYRSMHLVLWQRLFESVDAGWSGAALDVRHPYVDLRMLRFLLAVPAMPWCRTKLLLRKAALGRLPRETLSRPKTPLRADPAFVKARGQTMMPCPPQAALLEPYVRIDRLSPGSANTPAVFSLTSRPRDLGCWLQGVNA